MVADERPYPIPFPCTSMAIMIALFDLVVGVGVAEVKDRWTMEQVVSSHFLTVRMVGESSRKFAWPAMRSAQRWGGVVRRHAPEPSVVPSQLFMCNCST